ncbi:lysozyme inhibitor LprI family protein [Aurantimonas sp. VKM B-3413]|uniref:lysozyme inhibitor LprI family protein n=1 Tax=Aurantimonas sp. VKM B-3413 TaxID=2779401 RepID=UPI001E44ADE5|nr:lysozyme inhibitor LprI family protein [Aurantimonas sp. VKM B-3413]MCB8839108.1 DUF1311 domain-containing protein [Aurantimonas sp. VKM B-3413]
MRHIVLTLSMVALIAHPALAETGDVKADTATVKACLSKAGDDPQGCVGVIANPCQDAPDGKSTQGIDACLDRELQAWDAILNERYRTAMTAAKEVDERLQAESGAEPSVAAALLKAQRAWIAFRDAECDRRYEFFKEGTIRTNIFYACVNALTADRAIALDPDRR